MGRESDFAAGGADAAGKGAIEGGKDAAFPGGGG